MKNKNELKFQQQAARASWMLPLIALLLMGIGNSAMEGVGSPLSGLIIGGLFLLMLVVGFLFGVIGCFGAKHFGKKTTLVPGLIGAVLNATIFGLIIAIAIPSFHKARNTALKNRKEFLQQVADQTNQGLPIVLEDGETRFDEVKVLSPDHLEYSYSFINYLKDEFDSEAFEAEARPTAQNNYRTLDQFRMFREKNIRLDLSYYDKVGVPILSITLPEE